MFNQAKAAGYEIFQVIQRKPLISNKPEGETPKKIEGSIDIRDVHFAYPSRPEKRILQGFSLSIPAGKTVALVGSSGCGKSTIISLVSRFYEPSRGWHPYATFNKFSYFFFLHSNILVTLELSA